MRVLLISLNRETEPFTAAPLGLALVASALVRAGHDVRVTDLLTEDGTDGLAAKIRGFAPEMVGLSLRNIESSTEFLLPSYLDTVELIRRETRAPIVAGGPGFSIMPAPVMGYLGLEYGIAGEGERAVVEFARALSEGRDPASVPGVCTMRDGVFSTTPREEIADLSEFPPPAWGLLPVEGYDMVGVQSKRGCSFSCVYCTYPMLEGRRMRLRPPEAVAGEIASLKAARGVEAFYFVDNVFNNPKSHAEAVCQALIADGSGAEWGALVSPIGIDRAFAELMKRAGCVSVEIGADSLSGASLAGLGKSFSPGDVMDAVGVCRDAGLMSMLFLILGGPNEDEHTLKETFDALEQISPDKVFAVSGIRIYPGTPLAKTAVREGVITPDDPLLLPKFYSSAKLGEELYAMADAFFKEHPDWLHYPARALADNKPRHRVAESAEQPVWSAEATCFLDGILAEIPRLVRPIAKKAVVREAARLAGARGLAAVSTSELRDAFLSQTPAPFRRSMEKSLRKSGLIDG